MHPCVLSSTVHSNQDAGTTEVSMDGCVDRQCDGYSVCDGILLGHEKECNNANCRNMDATRDYHTKWGKSQ